MPPPPPMAVRLTADLRPSAFFDVWPAAGSQRAYSLGWDRQTDRQADGSRYCLVTPYGAGHNNNCAFCVGNLSPVAHIMGGSIMFLIRSSVCAVQKLQVSG